MMATTINDDGLKRSLVVSAALHVFLLLFLYFGLPTLFTPLPQYHPPVPFEIVTIADITNTRIKEEEPKPEPKPEPPPPEVKAQTPPAPQALAQPQQPEELAVPIKKPEVKPKPPVPAKPKADEFAKLLKNLEADKKQEAAKTETKPDSKATPTPQADNQAPALSNRLTISEEDAVRRQVEQCWSPPIGARNAQTMVVQVTGDITPDGIVQNAEVVDKSRMATDPFYRSMGESAIRALYNPQCTPLKLPADKYEDWKHFVFTFDPRDLL
jgi:outer membrane biosynthesis protein TonB